MRFIVRLAVHPETVLDTGIKSANQSVPGIAGPVIARFQGKFYDRLILSRDKQDEADGGGMLGKYSKVNPLSFQGSTERDRAPSGYPKVFRNT